METDGALSATLAILSALLAPTILISACGSLTISTANRLGRSVDRVRRLSDELRSLVEAGARDTDRDERILFIYDQIEQSTRRTRLLHRALTAIYAALGTFVATSVAIGVVILTSERVSWLPTVTSGIGVALLFYACLMLIGETGIARRAIDGELDYIIALEKRHTPPELLERREQAAKALRWRDRLPFG
jgi:hypothetical protein